MQCTCGTEDAMLMPEELLFLLLGCDSHFCISLIRSMHNCFCWHGSIWNPATRRTLSKRMLMNKHDV